MSQANRTIESSGGFQTWTEASHCNSVEFLVAVTETVVLLTQQRRRRVPVVIPMKTVFLGSEKGGIQACPAKDKLILRLKSRQLLI